MSGRTIMERYNRFFANLLIIICILGILVGVNLLPGSPFKPEVRISTDAALFLGLSLIVLSMASAIIGSVLLVKYKPQPPPGWQYDDQWDYDDPEKDSIWEIILCLLIVLPIYIVITIVDKTRSIIKLFKKTVNEVFCDAFGLKE